MTRRQSPHAGAFIAIQRVTPAGMGAGVLALRCHALDAEGRLAPIHAAEEDNVSPALAWGRAPEAETFALIVEDPGARPQAGAAGAPFVHWMIWDIPGSALGLPQGVEPVAHPPGLPGATQGRNGLGEIGWCGPAPPAADGPHRYHFQLFAVARRLGAGAETRLDDLVNALKGAAIASGEIVGLYQTPDPGEAAGPRAVLRDVSDGRGEDRPRP